MKKIICILLGLFNLINIYAQNISYFSYTPGILIDLFNGNHIEKPGYYDNFNKKKEFERTIITVLDDEKQIYYETQYSNNLKTKEISKVHETVTTNILYDEKSRIVEYGDFSYVYLNDTTRALYYMNEKKEEEEIVFADDNIKIIKRFFTYTLPERKMIDDGISILEYYFDENGLMKMFLEHDWNSKGIKSSFIHRIIYEYDDKNRLIKIVNGYGNEDIRSITHISYDENDDMSELIVTDKNGEESYTEKFLNYDLFGNWHGKQEIRNGKVTETVIRQIFYKY